MQEFQMPPRLFSKRFITIGFIIIMLTGIILYFTDSVNQKIEKPKIEDIMDSIETVKPTDV